MQEPRSQVSALPIPGRGWLASPLALWMESRSTPIADAVEPGASDRVASREGPDPR